MKIIHHAKALYRIFRSREIENISERAGVAMGIWEDWREAIYEDLPDELFDRIDLYYLDLHWRKLVGIAYINIWNPKSWKFWE